MGRGKRQATASAGATVARELPLSDSGRSKLVPEIKAPSTRFDARMELVYELLPFRDEDRFPEPIAAGVRVVTLGAFERDGERMVWVEKAFKNERDMRAALESQASDPDDPNPLPAASLHFSGGKRDQEIELVSLDYSLVSGLSIGESCYQTLDIGAGSLADEANRESAAEFLIWLFEERS